MENQVKIHKEVNKSQREPLDIAEKVFGDKVYFSIICGIIALLIVIIANYITNVFYSSFFVKKGNIFEKAQYFPEALKNIKNIFIPNFSIFWLPGLIFFFFYFFVG